MSRSITVLWDFDDPAGSERRFRALAATEPHLRLVALTQVARAMGLQERYDDAHALLDEVAGADDGTLPEVAVRTSLERGRLLRSAGRSEDAIPLFQDAATRAATTLAEDEHLEALHVDALHMIALEGTPAQRVRRTRDGWRCATSGRSYARRALPGGWSAGCCASSAAPPTRSASSARSKAELEAAGEQDPYVDEELALLDAGRPAAGGSGTTVT